MDDAGNVNMKGMQGKVVYAWEKCEVDPTCCCAELSMEDASVQVYWPVRVNVGAC